MTTPDAPILVTAATGKTGRRVAAALAAADHPTRLASRSSATRLDWDDPSTFAPALAGTSAVYLVPPEPGGGDVAPFVAAAEAAGVERIVLLSARAPGQSGDDHLPTVEATVTGSSLPWTILRPSWFAQNFTEGVFVEGVAAGTLPLPVGDGEEPFIDVDDIAAVAVAVAALTGPGHEGRTYELSGPELLTFADALAAIAAAGGPSVDHVDLDIDAWVDGARAEQVPEGVVSVLRHLFDAIRAGENAHLSDGVEEALGRPATPFAAWATRTYGP